MAIGPLCKFFSDFFLFADSWKWYHSVSSSHFIFLNVKFFSSQKATNNKSTEKLGEEQKDRLICLPLNLNALEGVPFFDSLIWTFNYSCFALFVFVLSDLYNLVFPENKGFLEFWEF